MDKNIKIAILIPCYNEELTIKQVITDFQKELKKIKTIDGKKVNGEVVVYNNASTDSSAAKISETTAIAKYEHHKGKGNVVRSMFRDIDADVYVMVDADCTYSAKDLKKIITPVLTQNADMVIGDRLSSTYYEENKRPFHNFGNDLVKFLINFLYKTNITDVMTGYRAFSKRFVKCMPVMSDGFQIETEMTIFALKHKFNIVSLPIEYKDRPAGSTSKLNTYVDGMKVLFTIAKSWTIENAGFVLIALLGVFGFNFILYCLVGSSSILGMITSFFAKLFLILMVIFVLLAGPSIFIMPKLKEMEEIQMNQFIKECNKDEKDR